VEEETTRDSLMAYPLGDFGFGGVSDCPLLRRGMLCAIPPFFLETISCLVVIIGESD